MSINAFLFELERLFNVFYMIQFLYVNYIHHHADDYKICECLWCEHPVVVIYTKYLHLTTGGIFTLYFRKIIFI